MAKRSMFVGMDVHKESIDVSLAEEGRDGEVRHYGVIPVDGHHHREGRVIEEAARKKPEDEAAASPATTRNPDAPRTMRPR